MHLNSLSDAAGRRFAAELRAATAGAPRPGGPAHVMVEVNRRSVALVATGRQRRAVTADTSVVFYRGDWLSMCPPGGAPWDRSEVFLEATLEAFGICWIQEGGIYINAPAGCLLQAAGADTAVICGLSTSGCVRASALDALQHGFRPMVVAEACGDRASGPHDAALFDLEAKYADVVGEPDAVAHLSTRWPASG